MDVDIIPNDREMEKLRQDVAMRKRYTEYQRLQRELQTTDSEMGSDMDGSIQVADNYRTLYTSRTRHHVVDLFIHRLAKMFSLRPVIGNIIALLLSCLILYYLFYEVRIHGFTKYQSYFEIGIQLLAALQVIKSGTRSLILPFLALVVGTVVAHTLPHNQTLFHFGQVFYQRMMIVGIIGLAVSVLAID